MHIKQVEGQQGGLALVDVQGEVSALRLAVVEGVRKEAEAE